MKLYLNVFAELYFALNYYSTLGKSNFFCGG